MLREGERSSIRDAFRVNGGACGRELTVVRAGRGKLSVFVRRKYAYAPPKAGRAHVYFDKRNVRAVRRMDMNCLCSSSLWEGGDAGEGKREYRSEGRRRGARVYSRSAGADRSSSSSLHFPYVRVRLTIVTERYLRCKISISRPSFLCRSCARFDLPLIHSASLSFNRVSS